MGHDWRGNDPKETKMAMFMRSIAEIVRQHPKGISEEELLDMYYVRRDREYVEEALMRAKKEHLVIRKGDKLYNPSAVWGEE